MIPRLVAAELTRVQRELLLEHIDGSAFIEVALIADERRASRSTLKRLGLISHSAAVRPTHTFVTDAGREMICFLLAEYAETLIRAGFGVEAPADSTDLAERLRTTAR